MFSLTAIPSCGRACTGARSRAAAVRPCLASLGSRVIRASVAVLGNRGAAEASATARRPKGRARAGPSAGRNSRERNQPCSIVTHLSCSIMHPAATRLRSLFQSNSKGQRGALKGRLPDILGQPSSAPRTASSSKSARRLDWVSPTSASARGP